MKALYLSITGIALMALAACSQPAQSENEADASDIADVIVALEEEWANRAGAKDIDGIMDLHWDEAVQMPSGVPAIIGAEAVRASWVDMLQTQNLNLTWSSEFVKYSGDLAYDYGSAVITTPDGTDIPAKYVVIWERRDGEWKVIFDMFSPNQ